MARIVLQGRQHFDEIQDRLDYFIRDAVQKSGLASPERQKVLEALEPVAEAVSRRVKANTTLAEEEWTDEEEDNKRQRTMEPEDPLLASHVKELKETLSEKAAHLVDLRSSAPAKIKSGIAAGVRRAPRTRAVNKEGCLVVIEIDSENNTVSLKSLFENDNNKKRKAGDAVSSPWNPKNATEGYSHLARDLVQIGKAAEKNMNEANNILTVCGDYLSRPLPTTEKILAEKKMEMDENEQVVNAGVERMTRKQLASALGNGAVAGVGLVSALNGNSNNNNVVVKKNVISSSSVVVGVAE